MDVFVAEAGSTDSLGSSSAIDGYRRKHHKSSKNLKSCLAGLLNHTEELLVSEVSRDIILCRSSSKCSWILP